MSLIHAHVRTDFSLFFLGPGFGSADVWLVSRLGRRRAHGRRAIGHNFSLSVSTLMCCYILRKRVVIV